MDIKKTVTTRTAGSGDHFTSFIGGCYRFWHHGKYWSERSWLISVPAPLASIEDAVANEAAARAREACWDVLTDVAQLRQLADLLGTNWRRILRYALLAARKAVRAAKTTSKAAKAASKGSHRKPRVSDTSLDREYKSAIERQRKFKASRKSRKSKRGYRPTGDVLRDFAGYWLEYRYGWLPLLYSTEDAVKAFKMKTESPLRFGHSSTTVDLSQSASESWTQDSGNGSGTGTQTITGSRTYRGYAVAEVITGLQGDRFGADPITTAWELIPFSFVVDWFLGVGTWLTAISPFQSARLLGVAVSIKDSYTKYQGWNISWSGAESGSFGTVSTEITVEQYTRAQYGISSWPVWNPRLSNVRLLDLSALVLAGSALVRSVLNHKVKLK
jgi:hypothetical protein